MGLLLGRLIVRLRDLLMVLGRDLFGLDLTVGSDLVVHRLEPLDLGLGLLLLLLRRATVVLVERLDLDLERFGALLLRIDLLLFFSTAFACSSRALWRASCIFFFTFCSSALAVFSALMCGGILDWSSLALCTAE